MVDFCLKKRLFGGVSLQCVNVLLSASISSDAQNPSNFKANNKRSLYPPQ